MRAIPLCLALACALPAAAQDRAGHWFLDVHRIQPTLEGHYNGIQDGKPVSFDLVKDLALVKDKATVGGTLEYQGPRFGLQVSLERQDYTGANLVEREVVISGETFQAGAYVTSLIRTTNLTFNWTIRLLRGENLWLGLDLGARATTLDLDATGLAFGGAIPTVATAKFKSTIPVPQIGPSVGFSAFNGRVLGRAHYHYLGAKGASYHQTSVDLRVFPLSWLGLRAYSDIETFKVPQGSISDDLEVGLDRSGTGFGLVLRF